MNTDVCRWLEENGFGQFADVFATHQIDAEAFAALSEHHLRELGIPLGQRIKILAARARSPLPSKGAITHAERRRLTVMFVDLVGSTALSSRLDPENLRTVIRTYQESVALQAAQYDAHVAQYLGDGAMIYFGYPVAHEDDAERAVRAALAIMRQMAAMAPVEGERLTARIGIATGLVVVGDLIGTGAARERAVVGETPNLAARLQALANPGEIVVSDQTRTLIGGLFDLRELGAQFLRGIRAPTLAFRVNGELTVESRFEARQNTRLTELVGREPQLACLRNAWQAVSQGNGQFVLISGEAGIGKSRIVRAMLDSLDANSFIRVHQQCSPYHADSSLHPIIQQIARAANILPGDTSEVMFGRLKVLFDGAEREEIALIAALMGIDATSLGTAALTPQQQRLKTFDALVNQIVRLAERQPVVWVLEDAHWIDPTTLELLQRYVQTIAQSKILVIVTHRPEFHPDLSIDGRVTKVELIRLNKDQSAAIVRSLAKQKSLPAELLQEIVVKADGVPLFLEELTRTVIETSAAQQTDNTVVADRTIQRIAVPASLHDSLMARLDRLQPYKEVAQTAACIGREFAFDLLAAVCRLPEPALREALVSLEEADLIYTRTSAQQLQYAFKHALVRDAAYESLLNTNRQIIHSRLVAALEGDPKSSLQVLAQHAAEAGLTEKAIKYWQAAATQSAAQPAYREAFAHLSHAIALANQMADSREWNECRLGLWVALGQVSMPFYGYGHSKTLFVFAQARKLAGKLIDSPYRFSIEYATWIAYYVRGEHEKAIETTNCMIEQARDSEGLRLAAIRSLGISQMVTGRPLDACETFSQARTLAASLSDRARARRTTVADRFAADPEIATEFHVCLTLWSLGRIDEARDLVARSIAAARAMGHVHTLGHALVHAGIFSVVCRDTTEALNVSTEAIAFAEKYDMEMWRGYGLILHGFALALRGDLAKSVPYMEEGFRFLSYSQTGAMVPMHHAMQARTLAMLGDFKQARIHAAAVQEELTSGSERYFWPECRRLLGDYARHCEGTSSAEVESAYRSAMELARDQGAIAWQLYAATSLAQCWFERGENARAKELLGPLLAKLPQGRNSAGYLEAAALLM